VRLSSPIVWCGLPNPGRLRASESIPFSYLPEKPALLLELFRGFHCFRDGASFDPAFRLVQGTERPGGGHQRRTSAVGRLVLIPPPRKRPRQSVTPCLVTFKKKMPRYKCHSNRLPVRSRSFEFCGRFDSGHIQRSIPGFEAAHRVDHALSAKIKV